MFETTRIRAATLSPRTPPEIGRALGASSFEYSDLCEQLALLHRAGKLRLSRAECFGVSVPTFQWSEEVRPQ